MKKRSSSLLLPAVLGLLAIATPGYGVETSWTGATDVVWNKSGNWNNGIPGATGTDAQNTDIAIFRTEAGTSTVSLTDSNRNIGGIRFNAQADDDITITLSGNLRLQGNIVVEAGSTGRHRIATDGATAERLLRLGATSEEAGVYAYSIVNNSTALFTVDPKIDSSGGGSTVRTRNLTLGGSGDLLLTGGISGAQAQYPINIIKEGSGTATLAKATGSTYGTTTVNAGTLLLTNTSGSGTGAGAVLVGSAGKIGGSGRIETTAGLTLEGTLIAGLTATDTFRLKGNTTFVEGSRIQLTLGPDGAASSLTREGGNWSFSATQSVEFVFLPGAAAGLYSDLITGLAADPGVASWTVANAGWNGQFQWSGGNVSVLLTAIPEPSTLWLAGLAVGIGLLLHRRRALS